LFLKNNEKNTGGNAVPHRMPLVFSVLAIALAYSLLPLQNPAIPARAVSVRAMPKPETPGCGGGVRII